MLLFWLLGPYAADAAINLCNCVYLCLLWPYTTSPARGVTPVAILACVNAVKFSLAEMALAGGNSSQIASEKGSSLVFFI